MLMRVAAWRARATDELRGLVVEAVDVKDAPERRQLTRGPLALAHGARSTGQARAAVFPVSLAFSMRRGGAARIGPRPAVYYAAGRRCVVAARVIARTT